MIKALFFDLDGTLLTSEKTLHPATRAALAQCRAKGVRIYLATARSPRLDKMLHWTDAEFVLFDGGLYCNGACQQMGPDRTYAYIDPRAAMDCIRQVALHPGVHMSLHMEGDQHAFNYHLPDHMLAPWGVKRSDILPLDAEAARHAVKILVFYDDLVNTSTPLPPTLFPALQNLCSTRAQVYLTDEGRTIQLVGKETGKAAAIDRVRKQLGLAPEEIAVFGDDLNDTEMLALCPNSVAMGNAHPQAKAAAAHITRTNDEDGIAHALRDILHII